MPTTAATKQRRVDPELDRIASPPECERLAGASWDTLKRTYPDKIVKISPRRVGMRVRDALQLDSSNT
jgi:hypothetical protein